tara:strand:- start:6408 stop:6689 length:282 start_codon:yes stop_codon:yes gene_type:complete
MDIGKNPDLEEAVETDSPLKEMVVNYTGITLQPENGEVTVGMIVDLFSTEFPEFLMAVAEENWIRGYHQAFVDIEEGEKLVNKDNDETDEQTD